MNYSFIIVVLEKQAFCADERFTPNGESVARHNNCFLLLQTMSYIYSFISVEVLRCSASDRQFPGLLLFG